MDGVSIKDVRARSGGVNRQRIFVNIRGAVQGVGFRPFIFRLATELGLYGWVNNSVTGVQIDAEGYAEKIREFVKRIDAEKPPISSVQSIDIAYRIPVGYTRFSINRSDDRGEKESLLLPDIAACPDCVKEIFDPGNRRFRYPFTNCTNCGPRYSIIESLPYDRCNTTMKIFSMCDECKCEYEDPGNRRFHAQANACPKCGPHLELLNRNGETLAARDDALRAACTAIKEGRIVALKGLGGFQLLVDACNNTAVDCLRSRKARPRKPLALMYPDINSVANDFALSWLERDILLSPKAPIVLLRKGRHMRFNISSLVAPDNPNLGIMLPYTPLHHLIMHELEFPIVATSGNLSDEPICIDENEALERLSEIADCFLVHDRPIARQVDDSVVRISAGREMVIRGARGYAPISLSAESRPDSLAVGGHLKNTIAVSSRGKIFVSQHIGDLDTKQTYGAFNKTIESLSGIYDFKPKRIVCDLHPEYMSTGYAENKKLPLIKVQHHYAHALSCMADNGLQEPAMAVVWDGTGLGTDGTIWGGEFLSVDDRTFSRLAHLRTFRLPGGEKAVTETDRAAIGLLYEIFGENIVLMPEARFLKNLENNKTTVIMKMLERRINSPITSSAGRLFDAVASILDLCHYNSHEGEAAMMLEFAAEREAADSCYSFDIREMTDRYIIDWEPMIRDIFNDLKNSVSVGEVSAKFHNTLAEMILKVAEKSGMDNIVLSGGCFQNRYLLERTINCVRSNGLRPYWHHLIPTNDGGIAAGQIMALCAMGERRK